MSITVVPKGAKSTNGNFGGLGNTNTIASVSLGTGDILVFITGDPLNGLVPILSVKFILDIAGANTQIGATLTGQGPTFSVSFNASAQSVGAHTLSIVTTGANGTSTVTIPVTTS